MSGASKVMYSIANFFTWVVVVGCVVGIIIFPLQVVGILERSPEMTDGNLVGYSIGLGIVLLFSLISIALVRTAKRSGTSKGWDFLFVIIGVLSSNIFLILGGIFGLIASE